MIQSVRVRKNSGSVVVYFIVASGIVEAGRKEVVSSDSNAIASSSPREPKSHSPIPRRQVTRSILTLKRATYLEFEHSEGDIGIWEMIVQIRAYRAGRMLQWQQGREARMNLKVQNNLPC